MNGNNREDFSKWLSARLSRSSCNSYLSGLDNFSKYLNECIDVYSITSIDELNSLDVELTERLSAETDERQKDYWNDRRSFLRKYKEFISNESQGIFTKTKVDSMENATKEYKDLDRNMIYFGAPGVGKSYNMNRLAGEYFKGRYDRVTFYSDYSYDQFVGTYKQVVTKSSQVIAPMGLNISESELALFNEIDISRIDNSVDKGAIAGLLAFLFPDKTDTCSKAGLYSLSGSIPSAARPIRKYVEWKKLEKSSDITYAFTPDPFTETQVKALKDPDSDYLLIIEEINRADATGVFGDAFQLLDRQDNGESEYAITPSEDLAEYLDGEMPEWRDEWSGKLKIPSNMFIWATMNSADQGVFPLDTAFKRRWSFEYIPIDNAEDTVNKTWNTWRKDINKKLKELEIEEDKFLGAHFISGNIVGNRYSDITQDNAFKREFKNKVLMYLFEDAGKYHREDIFGDLKITLSEVFTRFDEWDFNADGNILDALGSSNNVKFVEEPQEDNNSCD